MAEAGMRTIAEDETLTLVIEGDPRGLRITHEGDGVILTMSGPDGIKGLQIVTDKEPEEA